MDPMGIDILSFQWSAAEPRFLYVMLLGRCPFEGSGVELQEADDSPVRLIDV